MSRPRRPAPPPAASGDLFAPRPVAAPPPAPAEPPPAAAPVPPGAASTAAEPLTVLALTQALKGAIEPRFANVWVQGEVANLRQQPSGHLYFSLKDGGATLPCVAWATLARKLRFRVEDGLELVVRGRVEIYPPHGKYQLVVAELEPRGAGALALQLEQVKERLRRDGLLDPDRKRPLPFLPRRVGVATSTSTAALRDFLRVLHGRFPGLPVLVAPCRVQGEGAAATVAAAVQALSRHGCDVIVVTRGGGSQEDLWPFNDELLARVIAASPVPVVSAIGHETDVSVSDLVADVRAATPTHAAQLVVPVRADLLEGLAGQGARLQRAVVRAVETRRAALRALQAELGDPSHLLSTQRHRLEDLVRRAQAGALRPLRGGRAGLEPLKGRLARCEPRARLRELRGRVDAAARRLEGWRTSTFRRESMRLAGLAARLEPSNVARLLSRGFALALAGGKLVTRSAQLAPGAPLRVGLGEGWVDTEVRSRDAGDDPVPGRGRGPGPVDPLAGRR